jgi:hypothetical protein
MECPKCSGGAYLSEEEFVKVLENSEPLKVVIKALYVCKACSERFSRLVYDNLEARLKTGETSSASSITSASSTDKAAEGLKFF